MILDIRGTNGAGKSYIVHYLLSHTPLCNEVNDKKGKTIGYHLKEYNCGIVGRYDRTCGGCDTIRTADEIEARVREFAARFDKVIFEGITVAHTFGRYNDLALDLGADDYYFLFLDTPVEVCIERVLNRRREKGNTKPFNPYKKMGLVSDYERVAVAYRKLKAAGRNVIDLNHKKPMPQVLHLLHQ